MAVKVMLAPAIASGEIGSAKRVRKMREPGAEPKPKRRRSAVYDADGQEVFITLMCLKCHKTRPLVQFGLRKMADGAIRNQPWCRTCRSGAGLEKLELAMNASADEAETVSGMQLLDAPAPDDLERPKVVPSGLVAAEVAAALAAGSGR